MKKFFRLYFGLLVPLSGLFIAASVIYFNNDYNFTKSLRLGVLTGFFIALAVSFFLTISLLIMRRTTKIKKTVSKKASPPKTEVIQKALKENIPTNLPKNEPTKIKNSQSNAKNTEQLFMLLMDKELALEVLYHAISEQNIGTLTENKEGEGHLTIKNDEEIIKLTVSSLTRHTTQIKVHSTSNTQNIKNIISYLKAKEYSFLQY